jgi:2-polyprenyl-3-methyl-5-hydroxy-6-metoxy-1,4-benzoquinol methylase
VDAGSQFKCWCGNADLAAFGPDYSLCSACGSLVSNEARGARVTRVSDEGRDYYGRDYWFHHQTEDLHYPPLTERSQLDLPERCSYWLRTVLKYRMPPARVLEIGCAHGGFVALLRCAGFDAVGLELSPWVANYAHETFQVPVLTGPLEDQRLEESSLDIVVLMDVLEHLPDPIGTMKEAMRALRPDGLIVIQTPEVPESIDYEELLAHDHPFRIQLKPAEHLFLFSRKGIQLFCDRIAASNLQFETPIFAHYDMHLVASREPLRECDPAATVSSLSSTPNGRFALALLDARKLIEKLGSDYGRCESDREARLGVIREQGQRIDWLEGQRSSLESEAAELRRNLRQAQSGVAELGRIIDERQAGLARLEIDAKRLARELDEAHGRFEAVEARHQESLAANTNRAAELEGRLAAAEADRSARLSVIHDQGRRLGELYGERNTLRHELASVTELLRASETDRADRLGVIEAQGRQMDDLEAERLRQDQHLSATEDALSALRDQHSSQTAELQQLIARNGYLENHWLTRLGTQLRILRSRPR